MARTDPSPQRATPHIAPQVEPLTEIEEKILEFMIQYLRANTYQPSIREIGERFGIKSTKTVSEHLQALADKGRLERDPSRSRGVKILSVDLGADSVVVPCFATVAGSLSGGDPERHVAVDRQLGGRAGAFMVRAAAGDLAALGVADGDLVLVSPVRADEIEEGAVVLASVGGRAGFQRCAVDDEGVRLETLPATGSAAVLTDGPDVRILGRVAGFYRRMEEIDASDLTQH